MAIWLAAVCGAWGQSTNFNGRITLAWDYPAAELPAMTFRVYQSTSLTVPMTNWTRVATVVATNQVQIVVQEAQNYFYCTPSNFWAQGPPSEVASTPALPRSDVNLSVSRN